MLRSAAGVLMITIASASAAQPAKKPPEKPRGKEVHIVRHGCPGEGGCDFKIWTTKAPTKLWAKPDETSAVVAQLTKGARVKGVAAQTVTTRLPLCTFVIPDEGYRADCLGPNCQPTKFQRGNTFHILQYQGEGSVLVEHSGAEFQIYERGEYVKRPNGKEEYVISNYKCEGDLKARTWVQVKLPNGTTGWSDRDNFNGTSQYD